MKFRRESAELISETKADSAKLIIEVGEGRSLDKGFLKELKKIALSPMTFSPGEQEFFLEVLEQPALDTLENWKLVQFITLASKANVIIRFLDKPHLNVVSNESTRMLLIKKIRESYLNNKNSKLKPVFGDKYSSQEIDQIYVNLAIVIKSDNDVSDNTISNENKTYQENRMVSSHEQIYGKKEEFPLSRLWSPILDKSGKLIEQTPKKILIEGWAGIGKTVLCQYLANLWAKDIQDSEKRWWLDNTELVIWIRLRNLTNYDEQNCCLGEVVRRECFGVEDSKDLSYPSANQIEADLQAMGDKVLLLLDGFDEVAELYRNPKEKNHQILTAKSELLTYMLLGNRYKYRVILTTRPSRVGQIIGLFDRHLETTGFKDDDIEEFVKKYFKDSSESCALLLNSMKKNPNLWGIAHIPVNLALICLIWKKGEKKQRIPQSMTMTALYSQTVLWLLRRDWSKQRLPKIQKK